MSQNSITRRIRVTKNGKLVRRAAGQSHSRGNKSGVQLRRRKKNRGLVVHREIIRKYQ